MVGSSAIAIAFIEPVSWTKTFQPAATDRVWSVALSADGRIAVSGSADKTVRMWKCPRVKNSHCLHGPAWAERLRPIWRRRRWRMPCKQQGLTPSWARPQLDTLPPKRRSDRRVGNIRVGSKPSHTLNYASAFIKRAHCGRTFNARKLLAGGIGQIYPRPAFRKSGRVDL
jgi:hypothetical protein